MSMVWKGVITMDKKRSMLLTIMIVIFVLVNSAPIVFLFIFDLADNEIYMKLQGPINFVLGLVTPIIFITQFKNKVFYKYLGIVMIVFSILGLAIGFSHGSNAYDVLRIASRVSQVICYIGLAIYAYRSEDLDRAFVLMLILITYGLYANQSLNDYFLRLDLPSVIQFVLRIVIPLVLSIGVFVYKLIVVSYECKVQNADRL